MNEFRNPDYRKVFRDADREDRPLHAAARRGETAEVERILELGGDVNERLSLVAEHGVFNSSLTPLMEAAWSPEADASTVRALLEHGADLAAVSEAGVNALFYAAASGRADKVKLLIDRGMDASVIQDRGFTPLHAACWYYYPYGVRANAEVVKVLIEHGAAVRATNCVGRTALHEVAECGGEAAVAIAEQLISAGARVDVGPPDGESPLMLARSAEVARLLLRFGADPRPRRAARHGTVGGVIDPAFSVLEYGDAIAAFLEVGVDVERRSPQGRTLLREAGRHANLSAIRVLIEAGASGLDDSFVHHAARHSDSEPGFVRFLHERGLRLDLPDSDGDLPIDLAIRSRNVNAVRELIELGASWGAEQERRLRSRYERAATPRSTPGHLESYIETLGSERWATLRRAVEEAGPVDPGAVDAVAQDLVDRPETGGSLLSWQRAVFVKVVAAQLRGEPPESGLATVDRHAVREFREIAEVMGITLE